MARKGESSERKFFLCPQTHIQTSFLHPLEYCWWNLSGRLHLQRGRLHLQKEEKSQRNPSGTQQVASRNYKRKSIAWTPQPSGKDCSDVSVLSKVKATSIGLLMLSSLVSMATIIRPASACGDLQGAQAWLDSLQALHLPQNFLLVLLSEGGFNTKLAPQPSASSHCSLHKDCKASTYGFIPPPTPTHSAV